MDPIRYFGTPSNDASRYGTVGVCARTQAINQSINHSIESTPDRDSTMAPTLSGCKLAQGGYAFRHSVMRSAQSLPLVFCSNAIVFWRTGLPLPGTGASPKLPPCTGVATGTLSRTLVQSAKSKNDIDNEILAGKPPKSSFRTPRTEGHDKTAACCVCQVGQEGC